MKWSEWFEIYDPRQKDSALLKSLAVITGEAWDAALASQWTPASQPPKTEGMCLVATDYCDEVIKDYWDGIKWVKFGNFVTHWMPLPTLPEEEK